MGGPDSKNVCCSSDGAEYLDLGEPWRLSLRREVMLALCGQLDV